MAGCCLCESAVGLIIGRYAFIIDNRRGNEIYDLSV